MRFFSLFGIITLFFFSVQAHIMEGNASFAPILEKVTPAVVNVYATRYVKYQRPSLLDNPFFGEFFGRSFGKDLQKRQHVQNALGSGVIINSSGVVVTNHHVIDGAKEFRVVLSDRQEYTARLILVDERTDLAVLQINGEGKTFPFLRYKDSDDVSVGDLVLAVGNPFGVGQTVTSGIISALARTQVGISDFQSFIQTDAPINPGNSGGALITVDGLLLGINTAIYSRSGGSNGIGFAIPANMVRQVVHSALKDGKIIRPWIGVDLQIISSSLAKTLKLERPLGALIVHIHPKSAFKIAGLRQGDVITHINGKEVIEPENLRFHLAVEEIGHRLALVYLRNGLQKKTHILLIVAPEVPSRNQTLLRGNHLFSGTEIANINPALAEELGKPTLTEGVTVIKVLNRSQAYRLGLRAGDMILKINDSSVKNVKDVHDILKHNVNTWSMELERKGRKIKASIR